MNNEDKEVKNISEGGDTVNFIQCTVMSKECETKKMPKQTVTGTIE